MIKRLFSLAACAAAWVLLICFAAEAHFQAILPSDEVVTADGSPDITLDLVFMHPFEGGVMDMGTPAAVGVVARGKREDLTGALKPVERDGHSAFALDYRVRKPGDHVFFVEPEPYFEPAEGSFIVHYAKVVVNAMGLEEGWDEELGLETEIVPLTRPYGLWTGSVFQGLVKVNGRPAPGVEVEVEYLNEGAAVRAPSDPYVTQVVRADAAGVFTAAMPRDGWWGFAALSERGSMITNPSDGRDYPVEIGAVMWVRVRDMEQPPPGAF
ncbi:MAG: DUF4198 domain-containing protein [bacterium]